MVEELGSSVKEGLASLPSKEEVKDDEKDKDDKEKDKDNKDKEKENSFNKHKTTTNECCVRILSIYLEYPSFKLVMNIFT